MSFIVEGNNGKSWQGANWVFDALADKFLSSLKNTSPELAERFEDAIESQIGYVDVSDILSNSKTRENWLSSIDTIIAEIDREGGKDWEDPSRFDSFLEKVKELKTIV